MICLTRIGLLFVHSDSVFDQNSLSFVDSPSDDDESDQEYDLVHNPS